MHKQGNEQKSFEQGSHNHYTDMPVGEVLRRTRTYYGLCIEDVETALHIRKSQLSALEEGDVEKLPGRVYAIGFIRAYAEFLGLDGDKIVRLFKAQQLGGHKVRPALNFPVSASESKRPHYFLLLASFTGFALLVGVFILTGGEPSQKNHEIPFVPQNLKIAAFGDDDGGLQKDNILERDAAVLAASIQPAAGTEGSEENLRNRLENDRPKNRVVINVDDDVWIEIRNKEGKTILSRVLKKGDSYIVPDRDGMMMDTGNIGGLEFTVDGTLIPKLGHAGEIRRQLSLAPDSLLPPSQIKITDQFQPTQLPSAGE